MIKRRFALFIIVSIHLIACTSTSTLHTDVLVVGGGTGGTAAGLQSAKMGMKTIIAEPTVWLGGMLSSAGVSAIDGNHHLPSGLWAEFRQKIYDVYGGPDSVFTGWVSNTMFEPRVADSILKMMASTSNHLSILYRHQFERVILKGDKIVGAIFLDESSGSRVTIYAKQVIDATELGDVMASANVPNDIGMEAESLTNEKVNVPETNDIIQDMTYVAILKDYGPAIDCTMVKPSGYDPMEFDCSCTSFCSDSLKLTTKVDVKKMLEYGKLPGGKYMINWPAKGNDIYLNTISMNEQERKLAYKKAKEKTMRFVYFIQTQLGYKHLGLADDQFPSFDRLPLIPYHREGRRLRGLVRLNLNHISSPYNQSQALYRTGVSVGDYPVDHHHRENIKAPQHLGFYPVPSFNVPLGSLIPEKYDGLIVSEKGISVSNVVNGTTRLQPCVLLTGQAAGVLASLSIKQQKQPRDVSVRAVQLELLNAGAYLMPYFDVKPTDPDFVAIQKLGSTGILKGVGEPYQWANRTWFYPDSMVNRNELKEGLNEIIPLKSVNTKHVTIKEAIHLVTDITHQYTSSLTERSIPDIKEIDKHVKDFWGDWGLKNFNLDRPISRRELSVLLMQTVDPFSLFEVDFNGHFKNSIHNN